MARVTDEQHELVVDVLKQMKILQETLSKSQMEFRQLCQNIRNELHRPQNVTNEESIISSVEPLRKFEDDQIDDTDLMESEITLDNIVSSELSDLQMVNETIHSKAGRVPATILKEESHSVSHVSHKMRDLPLKVQIYPMEPSLSLVCVLMIDGEDDVNGFAKIRKNLVATKVFNGMLLRYEKYRKKVRKLFLRSWKFKLKNRAYLAEECERMSLMDQFCVLDRDIDFFFGIRESDFYGAFSNESENKELVEVCESEEDVVEWMDADEREIGAELISKYEVNVPKGVAVASLEEVLVYQFDLYLEVYEWFGFKAENKRYVIEEERRLDDKSILNKSIQEDELSWKQHVINTVSGKHQVFADESTISLKVLNSVVEEETVIPVANEVIDGKVKYGDERKDGVCDANKKEDHVLGEERVFDQEPVKNYEKIEELELSSEEELIKTTLSLQAKSLIKSGQKKEETHLKMVKYRVEIDVKQEKETYVAEKVASTLMQCKNIEERRVTFKALISISLYHHNNQILVEAGIIEIMVEERFTKRVFSDVMNSGNEDATKPFTGGFIRFSPLIRVPKEVYLTTHQTQVSNNYILYGEVGRGEFGITYLCTDRENHQVIAGELISKRKLETTVDIDDVRSKVMIMSPLPESPNVVKLKVSYEDDENVHRDMEFCEGGGLFDQIVARGHYTECDVAVVARMIAEVVMMCHSNGVEHRDLKSENFLLTKKKEYSPLKAINFDLSLFCKLGEKLTEIVGRPYYVVQAVSKSDYGQEVGVIKKIFSLMDDDKNGKITYHELKAGLQKINSELGEPEIKMLMETADFDGNGFLDYRKFVAVIIHLQKIENNELLKLAFMFFEDGSTNIKAGTDGQKSLENTCEFLFKWRMLFFGSLLRPPEIKWVWPVNKFDMNLEDKVLLEEGDLMQIIQKRYESTAWIRRAQK